MFGFVILLLSSELVSQSSLGIYITVFSIFSAGSSSGASFPLLAVFVVCWSFKFNGYGVLFFFGVPASVDVWLASESLGVLMTACRGMVTSVPKTLHLEFWM